MASTYVNDLRLNEMATGDASGTWGEVTNTNLELIAEAFSYGTEAITTNADTHTTTIADGATDPGRSMYLKYTGTLDSACTITIGPNTVSKMWFIENATSGSQNIIISQGSGANITIPPGDVKVVYSDGAGSGAAVVDAFASLSVVDLKVQDDLTVTDDVAIGGLATVGGTLGVTGIATFTDDIIIGDGKTIGSASDVDAMTIAANGQVTFTQTLIGTALDISGDIDVDGTTNLDVVDIDGAVDMASTLGVGGRVTAAGVTTSAALISTSNSNNLGNTTISALIVDNFTLDGTTLALSSGDMTLDAAGDIILDADGGDVSFRDAGVEYGRITNNSTNLQIYSAVQDVDIQFKGNDNGSTVTALTLDMSAAGTAQFNHDIEMVDNAFLRMGAGGDLIAYSDGTNALINANNGNLSFDIAGDMVIDVDGGDIYLNDNGTGRGQISMANTDLTIISATSDRDLIFKGVDGASVITALTLDMSNAGAATFNSSVTALKGIFTQTGGDYAAVFTTPFDYVAKFISTDSAAFIVLQDSNSTDNYNRIGAVGDSIQIESGNVENALFTSTASVFNENSVDMDFRVESDNLTHAFVVDGAEGKTGIGANVTGARLSVFEAEAGIICTYLQNGNATILNSSASMLYLQATGDAAIQDGYKMVQFADSNTVLGSISTAASSTNVSYNTSSDERLKENIVDMPSQLENILKVQPRQFDWKKHGNTANGFIAQELYETYPEAVTVGLEDETQDPWSVDYGRLTPFIIKAMQEQQEIIESLKARIAALENK